MRTINNTTLQNEAVKETLENRKQNLHTVTNMLDKLLFIILELIYSSLWIECVNKNSTIALWLDKHLLLGQSWLSNAIPADTSWCKVKLAVDLWTILFILTSCTSVRLDQPCHQSYWSTASHIHRQVVTIKYNFNGYPIQKCYFFAIRWISLHAHFVWHYSRRVSKTYSPQKFSTSQETTGISLPHLPHSVPVWCRLRITEQCLQL